MNGDRFEADPASDLVYVPQYLYDRAVKEGLDVSKLGVLQAPPEPEPTQPVVWTNRAARRAAARKNRAR